MNKVSDQIYCYREYCKILPKSVGGGTKIQQNHSYNN